MALDVIRLANHHYKNVTGPLTYYCVNTVYLVLVFLYGGLWGPHEWSPNELSLSASDFRIFRHGAIDLYQLRYPRIGSHMAISYTFYYRLIQ